MASEVKPCEALCVRAYGPYGPYAKLCDFKVEDEMPRVVIHRRFLFKQQLKRQTEQQLKKQGKLNGQL